jgi:hypothetical protein
MSGNIRNLWVLSVVVVGSVVAVRSLSASSASPEAVLDDPPISMASTKRVELEDASLAEVIRRFASLARIPRHETAR